MEVNYDVFEIKKPKFIMLGGIPGSGKSYCAKYLLDLIGKDKTEIVNLDEIRKSIVGSYGDFSHDTLVFERARIMAAEFIDKGLNVIWDSTNTISYNRKLTLETVKNYSSKDFSHYFLYFSKSLSECIKNNEKRERKCPEELIVKMFLKQHIPFNMSNIIVLKSEDLSLLKTFLN